jgi:hypothetical protein
MDDRRVQARNRHVKFCGVCLQYAVEPTMRNNVSLVRILKKIDS